MNLLMNKKVMKYTFNDKIVYDFYKLSIRKSNDYNHNYSYDLLKKFNIIEPNNFENYSFGKKKITQLISF